MMKRSHLSQLLWTSFGYNKELNIDFFNFKGDKLREKLNIKK